MRNLVMICRFTFFTIIVLSQLSYAQDIIYEDIALPNYIPQEIVVVVYKQATPLVKRQLLSEFKTSNANLLNKCSEEFDNYENWYCEFNPKLVFQGINAFGKRKRVAALCQQDKSLKKYRYLDRELLIRHRCVIASWYSSSEPYAFHTYQEWFGD